MIFSTHYRKALTLMGLALLATSAHALDFTVDGLTYTTLSDNTVSVKKYVSGTDVVIPSTVTYSDTEYAVTDITREAFKGSNIESVSIPGSVKTIDRNAFNLSTVKKVTIEEGVESLGYGTFYKCSNLESINLPSSLTDLGAIWTVLGEGGRTFFQCSSLKEIVIPESITDIPPLTFSQCTSLSKVQLPNNLESMGERAFEYCSSLTSIQLPSTLTTLERGVFQGTGLESITIPGSVKVIPNSLCLWCHGLQKLTIEEGVEEVGKQSFADCQSLTSIEFPNSVEWIRSDAFMSNDNITTIYLGEGLRRLGNCSLAVWDPDVTATPQWSLTDIYIKSPVPPVHEQNDDHFDILPDDFFFGNETSFPTPYREEFFENVKLHVPVGAAEAYRTATVWEDFKNIIEDNSGIIAPEAEGGPEVNGTIVTAPGASIEVFNLAGVKVASAVGNFDLSTLAHGVYIVRSGNLTVKVMN